jgi:hypothetical protein
MTKRVLQTILLVLVATIAFVVWKRPGKFEGVNRLAKK